jgi:hypothetical protein
MWKLWGFFFFLLREVLAFRFWVILSENFGVFFGIFFGNGDVISGQFLDLGCFN